MLISKFDTTNIGDYIERFQSRNNVILPDEYKTFLLKYNGGMTPKTKFNINKVSSDIRYFYGLGNVNEDYNLQYLIDKRNEFQNYLKEKMLPIAANAFGDDIILCILEKDRGSIYFRYHDRNKKYIRLTDSLPEFVSKCKSEKIGYIPTIEERKQKLIQNGKAANITDGLIKLWQVEIDKYAGIKQEEVKLI